MAGGGEGKFYVNAFLVYVHAAAVRVLHTNLCGAFRGTVQG